MEQKECDHCHVKIKEKVKTYHVAECARGCKTHYHHTSKCFKRHMRNAWKTKGVVQDIPHGRDITVEEVRNIGWEAIPPTIPCLKCGSPVKSVRNCHRKKIHGTNDQFRYEESRVNVLPGMVREICKRYVRLVFNRLINTRFKNVEYNAKPRLGYWNRLELSNRVENPQWLIDLVDETRGRLNGYMGAD